MVIDTSVIVAILFDEPERDHFTRLIDQADTRLVSAVGRLDDQLNSIYNDAMRRLSPEGQRRLDRDEDAWVAERRQCGADPNCITQAYRRRMRQLQGEVGAAEQPPRNPPPGFPLPPPPFRPYGGAPVATAPGSGADPPASAGGADV